MFQLSHVSISLYLAVVFTLRAQGEFAVGISSIGGLDNLDPTLSLLSAFPDTLEEGDLLAAEVLAEDHGSSMLELRLLGNLQSEPERVLYRLFAPPGIMTIETVLEPGQWDLRIDVRDPIGNSADIPPMSLFVVANTAVEPNEPSTFRLLAPTPNPFNPSCRIRFELPAVGNVTLQLYSLDGATVLRRNLGSRPAGVTTWTLNASDLASGLYLLDLDWRGHHAQTKLMVLK